MLVLNETVLVLADFGSLSGDFASRRFRKVSRGGAGHAEGGTASRRIQLAVGSRSCEEFEYRLVLVLRETLREAVLDSLTFAVHVECWLRLALPS